MTDKALIGQIDGVERTLRTLAANPLTATAHRHIRESASKLRAVTGEMRGMTDTTEPATARPATAETGNPLSAELRRIADVLEAAGNPDRLSVYVTILTSRLIGSEAERTAIVDDLGTRLTGAPGKPDKTGPLWSHAAKSSNSADVYTLIETMIEPPPGADAEALAARVAELEAIIAAQGGAR